MFCDADAAATGDISAVNSIESSGSNDGRNDSVSTWLVIGKAQSCSLVSVLLFTCSDDADGIDCDDAAARGDCSFFLLD